jgi:hypothetical protein
MALIGQDHNELEGATFERPKALTPVQKIQEG